MAAVRLLFLLLLLISSLSPISLSLSVNQALLKIKRSFTHADALSSWVPDSSPCSAKCKGVICSGGIITGLHLAGLVFLLVIFGCGIYAKYKDDNFSILGIKEMEDDQEVKVHVPSSNHSKEMKYSTWLKSDSKKGSSHGKNGIGDLLMMNDEKGTFGMADFMKAAAEVLGNGGLGSAVLLPSLFPPTSGLGFTQEICGKTYALVDV
ncbi:hypothetical protein CJ030_MR1G022519 [Morella rubra]|uniref:Leucine-rich repeat-containing N-terminal plant-type domain-containing protein n=1 Tax=Morella rubra TaxID=262757 RepID=A0A6A1WNC5_9ROSI|nr:hypothetical protein CJ030_MR1G022519 [Morella rubra]